MHDVLVEGDELAEHRRRELLGEDHRVGPVAGELAIGLARGCVAPERQRLGLGEQIGHQQVVMLAVRVVRRGEADEVDRHDAGALVEQLVERVLAVGARLAPHDRARLAGHRRPVEAHRLAVGFHVELLEIRRESAQLLRVRQHRLGGEAEPVGVPDPEQRHQHRRVRGERGGAEVFVDDVEPVQELTEAFGSDGDHQRQPDGGVDRVAPADPVPESEHVRGVDAELGDPLGVGRHRHEVVGDRRLAECVDQPRASGPGVGERLDRAERLRGHHEQCRGGIGVGEHGRDVGAVDVGHERTADAFVAVRLERPVRHRRSQVGAADPDVDHMGDPVVGAHPVGEGAHRVEYLVHVGDDVRAVDGDHGAPRCPQGDVHHRPVLGDVDVLAGEHRVASGLDAATLGERDETGQHHVVDAMLGVVDAQVADLDDIALGAAGVVGEQLSEVGGTGQLGQRRSEVGGVHPGEVHRRRT